MAVKIALTGNPNSGKTTLFNALTGSNQFVGNWPGVTVEKKEGKLRGHKDVVITDLPGIYSLSPYTLEEVVARDHLLGERPDVILNIVDGTNIERNLYLTTQVLELGIPVVVALNMMDEVDKHGDKIHVEKLSEKLGCQVVPISALKGTGVQKLAEVAVRMAEEGSDSKILHRFSDTLEKALSSIEELLANEVAPELKRFYSIKIFERDEKIQEQHKIDSVTENLIKAIEEKMDDDSESIITGERYSFISSIVKECCARKSHEKLNPSDKIDRIVTNKWLALPIFAIVMFIVYYISVTTVGTWATDWANEGVFGEGWNLFGIKKLWIPGIPAIIGSGLGAIGVAPWLESLIVDGIIGGVGAVLGFVPQMLVLFLFLAFIEACGYMARIAFIMDRIFRKFGLSGKSFIPLLIGTGCGIPGIMASRTIENDRDRRMTIITTTFMPCGAKLPIIALISGALFGGIWWVAPSAYFIGIAAIILSGILLKKTKLFAGDPAPFVMELPPYRMPAFINVLRSMWERGFSFIKKAGTVILLSSVVIWFLSGFGIVDGRLAMTEDMGASILAKIGDAISWIFVPLGFGSWDATVATFTGLIAKENVVGTFGVLYGFSEVAEDGIEIWGRLATSFTALSAYSFLIFNLLCAPCFAAIGAIRREMNSTHWTLFAVGYQTVFAYCISLFVYQFGRLIGSGVFGVGTVLAFVVLAGLLYLLLRPSRKSNRYAKADKSALTA